MRLTNFSVTNYKVFKEEYTIDFSKDSIAILTGRNNTGKSTILEAINCFFQKETKAKTIPNDCFSERRKNIVLKAVFESGEDKVTIVKKYKEESAPSFYDENDAEIKGTHESKDKLEEVLNNKPFYITPSMLPDDINDLIQNIYSEIIKNDLQKLEDFNGDPEEEKEMFQLAQEYSQIKKSYPEFLRRIKLNTDKILEQVSNDVSDNLRVLFSNEHLSLNVVGGESEGFSSTDILKSTNSNVHIDSNISTKMSLANQGTGLQRMSLIYLIQNMIEKKLLDENENKLLLIDEPEAFLHPEAVRALSRSLYKIGQKMPLMISTHSPILIDLSERHTSIQVFRVGEKEAIQLYKSVSEQFDEDDIQNMKILNYVDSYVNEFFFADKVVIVEGDTEYIAFKHLAKQRHNNIHIIRARGKATIATLMKILNQFSSSYDVLHDVDNHIKYSSSTLKAQFTNCKKILELKINDDIRVFCSISNFENAINIGDVENDKKTQTIYQILHETSGTGDFAKARKLVENLFENIINRGEDKSLDGEFRSINSEKDYDDLFVDLIQQKTNEEMEEKKKKQEKILTV
ncbi:ATP-dependent nuclease [Paenibacillus jilunlii]|uniref:OLD family endonuclease n=1 Tax=Paenibacillus jilunlii TaxID=682956 RepID=A0A1G9WK37_9BACL|nr:AAA family ATPase [Paenibacillus jilunlii]KWX73543.1 OLD family endonuclease [Paenibacillus jilunlii]SDM84526.1 Predicted ATP-dependent endonuclease of the OLD family, contains P-loop ATPase and TOPRIM domains [Paenibacillus jilunlii]